MARAAEGPGGSAVATAPRRRRRRTQEQRSAETRARVIAAATECVVERGFRGATMTAISKQAGVTWGAIQHQFGDKDAILDAVQERALAMLAERFEEVGRTSPDAGERVRRFTTAAGELLRGRSYRAFIEIQLNRGRESGGGSDDAFERQVARVLDQAWEDAFGDLGLSRRAIAESKRFAFVVLAGLATEIMLFPRVDRSRQQLLTLRDTLLRIFEAAA